MPHPDASSKRWTTSGESSPYYIRICRIWRPVLIKIRQGCHFCFPFVWIFFNKLSENVGEAAGSARSCGGSSDRRRFSHLKAPQPYEVFKCESLRWLLNRFHSACTERLEKLTLTNFCFRDGPVLLSVGYLIEWCASLLTNAFSERKTKDVWDAL